MTASPLIEVQGLGYSLNRGRKKVLQDVQFKVEAGSFVGLIGENGSGKTTLLDLLMGFRKPSSGTISVLGHSPASDPWQSRREIGYLSEKLDLPGDWTIQEFFDFHQFFYSTYSRELERELLDSFRLDPKQRMGNLSAGESRRAQIVGVMSARPKVLLVDEITAVLDIVGRQRFLQMLRKQSEQGTTLVMATNILEDLDRFITHVAVLRHGNLNGCEELRTFTNKSKEGFAQQIVTRLEAA